MNVFYLYGHTLLQKKVFFPLLLCLFFCTCVRAQEVPLSYRLLADEAQAAYQADQPRKALKLYDKAFSINKQQVADLLRATIVAESIKKLEIAEDLFVYLFDNYPLETAITYLEGPEFEPTRSGPYYEMFIHRAAFGMGPEQNGRIKTGRFDKVAHRYAMPNDRYVLLVEIAHRSMIKKDFQRAIYYYELAFSMKRKSQLSLLRAAACYYHTKDQEVASAYLEEAFQSFSAFALKTIRLMPDFQESLAHPQFAAMVGREISLHFPDLNTELIAEIDRLNTLFLTHRKAEPNQYDISRIPYFTLMVSDIEKRALQDSIDQIISARMDALLQTYGYPTTSLVADRQQEFDRLCYAVAPEVITTHWDKILLGSSMEKFSVFRKPFALAIRHDSNCYRRGLKQKFGGIWFVPESLKDTGIGVWPIEHPSKVDERRAEIGLETMKEYTKSYRRKFNLKAQQSIGKLPFNVRDEVHANSFPRKELSDFPYSYQ